MQGILFTSKNNKIAVFQIILKNFTQFHMAFWA